MWRYVNCPNCESKNYEGILVDPLTWEGKHVSFKIVKCLDCGLIFTNPLSETGIGRTYHNVNPREAAKEEYLRRIRGFHYALEEITNIVEKRCQKLDEVKILDIGCGCGAFLDIARIFGFQGYGIEASKAQANYAKDELYLNVKVGDNLECYKDECFDVVTMFEVLEHIETPRKFLGNIGRVLKNDGYLTCSIPNASFQILKARIFKHLRVRKEAFLGPGEHVVHYTKSTIRNLLNDMGFSILKLENARMVLGPKTSDFGLLKIPYQWLSDIIFKLTGVCVGRGLFVIAKKDDFVKARIE